MERRGFMGMLGAAWAAISAKLFLPKDAEVDGCQEHLIWPEIRGGAVMECVAILNLRLWCQQRGIGFDIGYERPGWIVNIYSHKYDCGVCAGISQDLLTAIETAKEWASQNAAPKAKARMQSEGLAIQAAAKALNMICEVRGLSWRVEEEAKIFHVKAWGGGKLVARRSSRSVIDGLYCAMDAVKHDWKPQGKKLAATRLKSATDPLCQLVGTSDEIRAMLMGKT